MTSVVVLFGGSGMLGRYVYHLLSQFFFTLDVPRQSFDINASLEDTEVFLTALLTNMPRAMRVYVVNCSGVICHRREASASEMWRVNAMFPHKLARWCEQHHNARLVHVTTDCVFSGNALWSPEKNSMRGYCEFDRHDADTVYGVSKSLGEPISDRCTTIRTSIVGEELFNKVSLLEWVKSQNAMKKQITGFTNHIWNGVTCLQLAKIIGSIVANYSAYGWTGVRHIHSSPAITKAQLIELICKTYNFTERLLLVETDRAVNRSLRSLYSTSAMFNIPSYQDQLIAQKAFRLKL